MITKCVSLVIVSSSYDRVLSLACLTVWKHFTFLSSPEILSKLYRSNRYNGFVKEPRRSCSYTNTWRKYNYDIENKGQDHTEVMNIGNTSSYGDKNSLCQCQNKHLSTKTWQDSYRFDLDLKGQCRIGIMNVRDTSSHCDMPMCVKCGDPMSKQKTVMGLTRICADRQTVRRTNGQTDGQKEWLLYTPAWPLFTGEGGEL